MEQQTKQFELQLKQQQQQPVVSQKASSPVPQQQQPKKQRNAPTEQEIAARQSALAKSARDTELNRKRNEKADRRARHAEIRQLVAQHRIPKIEGDEFFSFVDGKKIRRIFADAATRERLMRGEVAIVRCEGRYDLVPAEIAVRIRDRDSRVVIAATGDASKADSASVPDAGYAQFVVPDDLMW